MDMRQARMIKRRRLGPGGTTISDADAIASFKMRETQIRVLRNLRLNVQRKGMSVERRAAVVGLFPELSDATKETIIARAIELIDQAIVAAKSAHGKRMEKSAERKIAKAAKVKAERAGRAALAPQKKAEKKAKRKAADERRKERRRAREKCLTNL